MTFTVLCWSKTKGRGYNVGYGFYKRNCITWKVNQKPAHPGTFIMITVGIHGPVVFSQFFRNQSELISNDLKGERVFKRWDGGKSRVTWILQGPGWEGSWAKEQKEGFLNSSPAKRNLKVIVPTPYRNTMESCINMLTLSISKQTL